MGDEFYTVQYSSVRYCITSLHCLFRCSFSSWAGRSKGGQSRAEELGSSGYAEMGSQGGQTRAEQMGREGYQEMGRKGGLSTAEKSGEERAKEEGIEIDESKYRTK